jgi:copper homeostasis protein CutC
MAYSEVDSSNLESVEKNTGKKKIHTTTDQKSTRKKGSRKGAGKLKKKLSKRF